MDESSYFTLMLSGRLAESRCQDNEHMFIDAGPDLVVYILRYSRRGVFPLFWDKSKVRSMRGIAQRSAVFGHPGLGRLDIRKVVSESSPAEIHDKGD